MQKHCLKISGEFHKSETLNKAQTRGKLAFKWATSPRIKIHTINLSLGMMHYHTLSWKENFKWYKDPYQYMMLKGLQIITFKLKFVIPRTFKGYVYDFLLLLRFLVYKRCHYGSHIWDLNQNYNEWQPNELQKTTPWLRQEKLVSEQGPVIVTINFTLTATKSQHPQNAWGTQFTKPH